MTTELRLRGVNVVTAQEDGAGQFKDPILLDRAAAQGRVLVTHDTDFLREAAPPSRSIDRLRGNHLYRPTRRYHRARRCRS